MIDSSDLLDGLRRATLSIVEGGLLATSTVLEAAQRGVRRAAGQPDPPPLKGPPIGGPRDIDRALAEFVNRLVRLVRYSSVESVGAGATIHEIADAAGATLGALDWNDARRIATAPFEMPLSLGRLAAQESLRALYCVYMLGPDGPQYMREIAGAFLDGPVFLGLKYTGQLDRLRARVRQAPGDADAWLVLGRYAMQCGLQLEAIDAFTGAAAIPEARKRALYLRAVANCHAGRYADAACDATESLRFDANQPRAQYWLSLAASRLGGYPDAVPEPYRVTMAAGRHGTPLRFESVAAAIGLDKTSDGRGSAVFDYDGDGHLDVLIASLSGCSLFHNNGDGTFVDVSVGSGLDTAVSSFAAMVGDYDNDGRPDVFVGRIGFLDGASGLYRNNGDGTFTNVTEPAGIGCWLPTFGAAWVDFNCDGLLDLFIGSNVNGLLGRKAPDRLYRNNGDGTFTDVAGPAGLTTEWPTMGCAWGDYDNDGLPDVFLSSAFGRSQLFHNNGNGTFTNVSRHAGIDAPSLGSVAYWCDYDNDGWLDLIQGIWCPQDEMLHTLRRGAGPPGGQHLRIYHNNRDGTFTEVSRDLGVDECWGTMSGNAGDLDNDGHIDLLLGNGGPQMERNEPPVVLLNDGRGRFRNVTFTAGLPMSGKSHGANLADLAGDGRLSIILASGGFYPGEQMTTEVWRPVRRPGNYLNVRLVGTTSNRDAVGARVRLVADGPVQHRLVSGGSNFGCLPYEQHFGLGEIAAITRVEIDWPSRHRQQVTGLPVNATVSITEGRDGYVVVKRG